MVYTFNNLLYIHLFLNNYNKKKTIYFLIYYLFKTITNVPFGFRYVFFRTFSSSADASGPG